MSGGKTNAGPACSPRGHGKRCQRLRPCDGPGRVPTAGPGMALAAVIAAVADH